MGLLFSDRVKIRAMYDKWLDQEMENNQYIINDCPETFIAFLQTKGWLKEDDILKVTRPEKRES